MSIRIDKSLFTPEELSTYKALIAKATVDPEAAEREMEDERPDFPPRKKRVFEEGFEEKEVDETEKSCGTKKSADPALTAALERLESLEKSIEMKEYSEVAKKYAVLGEDEEQLAKTLYEMHKSSPDNYEAYIDVLEKSLGLVEKSGIFAEIGKSGSGYGMSGGTVGKIESIASEIRKSNPDIGYEQSIAKAWENNPDLIAEYEREYSK